MNSLHQISLKNSILTLLLLVGFQAPLFLLAQGNLALGKRTRQSSNYHLSHGRSDVAVDGVTDGRWNVRSVTHTAANGGKGTFNPWWEVDLGGVYEITHIEVYGRTDCCTSRLTNYKILVDGKAFTPDIQPYKSVVTYPLHFFGKQTGSKVRIQMYSTGILSLAEVKVFGKPSAAKKEFEFYTVKIRNTSDWTISFRASGRDGGIQNWTNVKKGQTGEVKILGPMDGYEIQYLDINKWKELPGTPVYNPEDGNQSFTVSGTIFSGIKMNNNNH